MSNYLIEFTPAAAKQLRKLPREVQVRIGKAIDKFSNHPFPVDSRKVSGQKDLYRIRVGDYRIFYQFNAGKHDRFPLKREGETEGVRDCTTLSS